MREIFADHIPDDLISKIYKELIQHKLILKMSGGTKWTFSREDVQMENAQPC